MWRLTVAENRACAVLCSCRRLGEDTRLTVTGFALNNPVIIQRHIGSCHDQVQEHAVICRIILKDC